MDKLKFSQILGKSIKQCSHSGKDLDSFLYNSTYTYHSPRNLPKRNTSHKKACMQKFIELFKITKTLKQSHVHQLEKE